MYIAEVQIRRHVARVERDRGLEPAQCLRHLSAPERLETNLVLEKRENLVVTLRRALSLKAGKLLPCRVRVAPLVLFLVQLLQIRERVLVVGVEPQDVL